MQHLVATVRIGNLKAFLSHCLCPKEMRWPGLQGTHIGGSKIPAGSTILGYPTEDDWKVQLGRFHKAPVHSSFAVTARVFIFADGGCKSQKEQR